MTITQKISKPDLESDKLIIEQWKTVISVQMHFNEMISRIRQVAATVGFGGTAYILSKPNDSLEVMFSLHSIGFTNKSMLFISLLIFIISIGLLDMFYFFRMLVSSVDIAKKTESDFDLPVKLTTYISKNTTKSQALLPVYFLYLCIVALNAVFLFYSLNII
jgi:hypothetical protein